MQDLRIQGQLLLLLAGAKRFDEPFPSPYRKGVGNATLKTILAFLLLLKFRNNLERYIKKQQNKTKGSKYMKNSFPSLLLVYWKRKKSAI
jgi:hypothetical protein